MTATTIDLPFLKYVSDLRKSADAVMQVLPPEHADLATRIIKPVADLVTRLVWTTTVIAIAPSLNAEVKISQYSIQVGTAETKMGVTGFDKDAVDYAIISSAPNLDTRAMLSAIFSDQDVADHIAALTIAAREGVGIEDYCRLTSEYIVSLCTAAMGVFGTITLSEDQE